MDKDIWAELRAEFLRDAVSWRAQTLTKNNDKALALAYVDARDVMNRLDDVVGVENWKDRYDFNAGTAICYLSIRFNGEWIEKADGAGSTDVEAEKGQISDALKRAAVKFGIGRYLYDLKSPWVPCETYERNGKHVWSAWKDDPWNHVRAVQAPKKQPEKLAEQPKTYAAHLTAISSATTLESLQNAFAEAWRSKLGDDDKGKLKDGYEAKKADLQKPNFDNLEKP